MGDFLMSCVVVLRLEIVCVPQTDHAVENLLLVTK